jgi:hypothetical protein
LRGIAVAAIGGALIVTALVAIIVFYLPASRTVAEIGTVPEQNSTEPATPVNTVGEYKKVNVTVNGVQLVADVAATGEQRSKGLAVKDSLAEHESMLFVFSKANDYQFWMKDMKFAIDIMWLDTDRKVVHVERSLEPCEPDEPCPTYGSGADSQYVLETVAGFAEKYDVTEGTLVEFDTTALQ